MAERLWLQNASSLSSCQTEVPVCQLISVNVAPSVWKSYISGFSHVLKTGNGINVMHHVN